MIGLEPSTHLIDEAQVNIGAAGYPILPTWLKTRATWSAETTTAHPSPGRLSASLWVPDDAALGLDLGAALACYAAGDPVLDPDAPERIGSVRRYFGGRVDAIETRARTVYTDRAVEVVDVWSVGVRDELGPIGTTGLGDGSLEWPAPVDGPHWVTVTLEAEVDAPSFVLMVPHVIEATVRADGLAVPWQGAPGAQTLTLPTVRAGQVVTVDLTIAPGMVWVTMTPPLAVVRGVWRHIPGQLVDVTASSYLAVMGRTYIGDEPWPVETVQARARRIAELVYQAAQIPVAVDEGQTLLDRQARALDVDRQSSLVLAQRVAAAAGGVVTEASHPDHVVQIGRQLELTTWLGTDDTGTVQIKDGNRVATIPARSIADRSRVRDLEDLSNIVAVRYTTPGDDGAASDRSLVTSDPDSVVRYGPSERTYETDLWVPAGQTVDVAAPGLAARSARIVAACASPSTRLDGAAVIPGRLARYCTGLLECVAEGARHGKPVRITGGPDDVTPSRRVIGGAVQFGEDPHVELELEDERRAAAQSVLIFRTYSWHVTLGQFKGSGVTIRDLAEIGA